MLVIFGPGSQRINVEVHAADIAADVNETRLGINSSGVPGQTNFDDQQVTIEFTPERVGMKMAAFSDDGVTVTIRDMTSGTTASAGTTVLNNKGTGQALPNLNQSLKDIDYTFLPNHTYEITVDYLNTYYTGDGDVDGAQLIAYGGEEGADDGTPQRPDIELTDPKVELISGYKPGGNTDGLVPRFKFTVTGANGTYRTIDVNSIALDDDTISNSVSEQMYFDTASATSAFILYRGTDHNHGFAGFLHFVKGIPYEQARMMTESENPALNSEHQAWRTSHVTMHPASGNLKVTYVYAAGKFLRMSGKRNEWSTQGGEVVPHSPKVRRRLLTRSIHTASPST